MVEFPPYRLDVAEERLWKGDKQLTLRRKPFAILRFLAENPGRLVTHAELLAHVWQGAVVSDSSVRSHLHELRTVLGDGVIETVIGRGFRFVAPIGAAAPVKERSERVVVGREDQLATLRAAHERANSGRRQVCFVTGRPGIGKTTVVGAFLDEVSATATCARGQCVEQYGAPEAYLALIGVLRELRASALGPQVLAALVRHAPTVLAQVPQLAPDDFAPRVKEGNEARLVREMIDALEAIAINDTVVIVLEDMQWSDVATIDVLAHLGQRSERTRLMIIVTARGGDVGGNEHPLNLVMRSLTTRHGAIAMPLERVARGAVDAYVAARFGAHVFPPELSEIVDRITEGTPLFMVSFLEDLVARGMLVERDGTWALAASLDDVAAHRTDSVVQLIDMQLDRLSPDEQQMIEAASLIGIEFSVGLVAAALETSEAAVDDTCDKLARRGLFLIAQDSEEWPDGSIQSRYRMTHGLVQEVALGRTSLARRQRRHRAIAEKLVAVWGERADIVAHSIAAHFDRAGAFSPAVRYYITAAEADARRFSVANSIALFSRARELIGRTPPSIDRDRDALRILQGLAPSVIRSSSSVPRDSLEMFEEMIDLARRIDDKTALVTALANLLMRLCTLSQYARAKQVLAQLDELLLTTPIGADLHAFVEVGRSFLLYWTGDMQAALPVMEAAAKRRGAVTGTKFGLVSPTDQAAIVQTYLGFLRFLLGDPDGYRALVDEQLQHARETGDPYSVALSLCAKGRMLLATDDDPLAIRAVAEEALAIPGSDPIAPIARLLIAAVRRHESPLDPAAASLALEAFNARTAMYPMGKTQLVVIVLETMRGLPETEALALKFADETLVYVREVGEHLLESELLRQRGELLESRDHAAARASYQEAIDVAVAQGAKGLERRARASLAKLA